MDITMTALIPPYPLQFIGVGNDLNCCHVKAPNLVCNTENQNVV